MLYGQKALSPSPQLTDVIEYCKYCKWLVQYHTPLLCKLTSIVKNTWINCERNRNKTKIFFAKALFAFIAKKNRVWHLQRNWKFCTYKFFVFVTLFAPKTCNSFCVTKNVTYQRNYSWSCSPNNMTQRSIPLRNKDFCCLTKTSRPPNLLDSIFEFWWHLREFR